MKSAYNAIVDEINAPNTLNLEGTELSDADDMKVESDSFEDNCVSVNPFVAYFDRKLSHFHASCDGGIKNAFFQPKHFDIILHKWLPMAPFWTCLLLGKYLYSLYLY